MSAQVDLLGDAIELLPDAVLVVDAAGTVVSANAQLCALFGFRREEVVNGSIDNLLPERFRLQRREHRDVFVLNPRTRPLGTGLELLGRKCDGSEFPLEISLRPLPGDLTAVAIRDASDRATAQRELVAARELAERANLAKSRFLATASHDLRQPLQALALLNGTLRRMPLSTDAAAAVAEQGQAIDTMRRLLNALLDISKLESGAIKPQPSDFRLAPLFDQLRGEFAAAAAEKGLQLQVEPSAQCAYGDPSLIEQVLRNLVSNAIKYTRVGRVRLCSRQRGALVRIEVLDTGIGIPGDQLPFIFDEFFQVGATGNAKRDGYGLGLSIVQRIVKLLGIRIDVQSQPGAGSTFALELPAAREQPAAANAPVNHEGTARQRGQAFRLLLVDDDRRVLNATRLLLGLEGYRVVGAASYAEALQCLREDANFDLVVTDYHLGGGETGLDVMESLRAVLGPSLPVVLMTGDTSSSMKRLPDDERLRLASKPIDADQLLGLIRELLEERASSGRHTGESMTMESRSL